MQLHELKLNNFRPSKKRIGRGGKKGTYCGRGVKGQKARSGKKPRVGFAGGDTTLVMRSPKKKGIIGKVKIRRGQKLQRYEHKSVSLNLSSLNQAFKHGDRVTPKSLLRKGLISKIRGKMPKVKILAQGELKKQLQFSGVKISKAAQQKIDNFKEKKTETKKNNKAKK